MAFAASAFADFPTMIVEPDAAIAKLFLSNRIESAADGFAECAIAFTVGFLQSTKTAILRVSDFPITGEDTVFAIYDACDEVAFTVGISHTLTVDYALCRCTQVAPYRIEAVLDFHHLIHVDWRSCIAFYAACSKTLVEITAEGFGQNIG